MRMVSAIWPEYYPFDALDKFKSGYSTRNPDDLKEGDALIVWGGEDIHPSLYDRPLSPMTGASRDGPGQRDRTEWALMNRAKEMGLPIIGVCRGAQMLCALAGGILIQHVNGHGGRHIVKTFDGKELLTNSIHHQMMFPKGTKHELVAWVPHRLSNVYHDGPDLREDVEIEPEFIYFPEVKGFAVQWHPEMMHAESDANKYVLNYINERL